MKIQVKTIKENEDGSANVEIDFDKEGLECLVQHGLISLIIQAIDVYKVRPEKDEALIQRAKDIVNDAKDKQLIKDHYERSFTGSVARNFAKIGRPRSKKQDA
jgi:hypothetical protein